jgi:hypothetical protein
MDDTSLELLFVGSTNVIELSKLTDNKLKTLPIDAVVAVSVFDAVGAPVANAQNLAMAYEPVVAANPPIPAIPAAYRGQIPSTVALVAGQHYTEKITAVQGGNTRIFNVPCLAVAG